MDLKDRIVSPRPEKKQRRTDDAANESTPEKALRFYNAKPAKVLKLIYLEPQVGQSLHNKSNILLRTHTTDLERNLNFMVNAYLRETIQQNGVSLAREYGQLRIELHTPSAVVDYLKQKKAMTDGSLSQLATEFVIENPASLRKYGFRGWLCDIGGPINMFTWSARHEIVTDSIPKQSGSLPWKWYAYLTRHPMDALTYYEINIDKVKALYNFYNAMFMIVKLSKAPEKYEEPKDLGDEKDPNLTEAFTWLRARLSAIRVALTPETRDQAAAQYEAELAQANMYLRNAAWKDKEQADMNMQRAVERLPEYMGSKAPFVLELKRLLGATKFDLVQEKQPPEDIDAERVAWAKIVQKLPAWKHRFWYVVADRPNPITTAPSLRQLLDFWQSSDTPMMTPEEIKALQANEAKLGFWERILLFRKDAQGRPKPVYRYQHKIACLSDFTGAGGTTFAVGPDALRTRALGLLIHGRKNEARALLALDGIQINGARLDKLNKSMLTPDEMLSYTNLQLLTTDNAEEAAQLGPSYIFTIIPQLVAVHPAVGFKNMMVALSQKLETKSVEYSQLKDAYTQRQHRTESSHQSAHKKLPDQLKKHIFQYLAARYVNNPLMSSMIAR